MGIMEKRLFRTKEELQAYLTAKGFTIANNKMTWNHMTHTTNAYWTVANDGIMNFHTSSDDTAFYYNIVDFSNDQQCACVFIELANNGCALYLSPLPSTATIADVTLSCANNYQSDGEGGYEKIEGQDLQNGLVVVTPPEEDGYWRYSWRDKDITGVFWDVDNCRDHTSKAQEITNKPLNTMYGCVTLGKTYLHYGDWSQYIFTQLVGDLSVPGCIFKMNGQKYIVFTDNPSYQCPAFRLPPEANGYNLSDSTDEYSPLLTYKVGDYCIYNGKLWRCIQAVETPGVFDNTKWTITTVTQEILRSGM